MKKMLVALLVVVSCINCVACGTTLESTGKNAKGTKDNPYTLDDIITITTHSFEDREITFPNNKPEDIGKNVFEISNMRVEDLEVTNNNTGKTTTVKTFIFDKKCKECCLENGINHLAVNGNVIAGGFFNSNMQELEYTDLTVEYAGKHEATIYYFGGTSYTFAYALGSLNNPNYEDTYDLMRFSYYDKNFEKKYVYVKLN